MSFSDWYRKNSFCITEHKEVRKHDKQCNKNIDRSNSCLRKMHKVKSKHQCCNSTDPCFLKHFLCKDINDRNH